MSVGLAIGKMIPSLGHWWPTDGIIINLFPPCRPTQLRVKLFGNQKFRDPLMPPPLLLYLGQRMIPPILCWLLYPPLTFFLFTNDSKRLHIQMNYSGGPNIVYCEQCILSCLTPQYNICSFVVLLRPPYLMGHVKVNAY